MVPPLVRERERVPPLTSVPAANALSFSDAVMALENNEQLAKVEDSIVGRRRRRLFVLAPGVMVLLVALAIAMGRGDRPSGSRPSEQPPIRETVDATALSAAEQVMTNARALCAIREETPHLVVECSTDIPLAQRLPFARAVADADAILSGQARNLYFYLPGGVQFAQADALNGIRLK